MNQTLHGVVVSVLVARDRKALRSAAEPQVRVMFEGFEGDRHAGLTMRAGSRHSAYPRGTEIRNTRQISIVSAEELEETARALGVPELKAEWLGANLLLRDIPRLALLPPGTRLYFARGAALVIEGENHPCTKAGESIQVAYPDLPGLAQMFPKAAVHRRGLVAWVERPGVIMPGDAAVAELPEQRIYQLV